MITGAVKSGKGREEGQTRRRGQGDSKCDLQLGILGFDDGARECRQPLGAEASPRLAASKEVGNSV